MRNVLLQGTVGKDLTAEEANKAAQWVGLNLLSTIKAEIGDLPVKLPLLAENLLEDPDGCSAACCPLFLLMWALHDDVIGFERNKVVKVHKLVGFVNCTDDFEAQPSVINGCSDLMFSVFGEKGIHVSEQKSISECPFSVRIFRAFAWCSGQP